ncbi:uncharacterized protein [Eurosta solidaginis]|uniref:uncharacterized protein n=1 Tax=Eurosta solidaginis TaxID=178769 RepID=UPI003530FFC9
MEAKLIRAVKKRPALYKRASIESKNKKCRDDAWAAVSRELGVPEEACRQRWKSLRDRFVRENTKLINESDDGVAVPSKCGWEFYRSLLFIEDEIKVRGIQNALSSSCCTRYSRNDKCLLYAVKDQPLLYDSNHRMFRNQLERQRAWCRISQKVGKRPDSCRNGWKELRERYIINKLEGQCNHADIMDFLKNHVDNTIESEDEQYTWPKEEKIEMQVDEHSYAADTSVQYSFSDEYTFDDKETLKKSFAKVYIESDEANELPTSSNTAALKRRKVMEANEKFETLVGTLNNFVESRIEKPSVRSRNYEYYKVLDRYLQKMSEDEQDKIKADILKMVFNCLDQ